MQIYAECRAWAGCAVNGPGSNKCPVWVVGVRTLTRKCIVTGVLQKPNPCWVKASVKRIKYLEYLLANK